MKAFFWKIIGSLGKMRVFKNFAKPIPRTAQPILEEKQNLDDSISYETFKTEVETVRAELIAAFEPAETGGEEMQNGNAAVAVLPEVICLPDSLLAFNNYDIQNTAVAIAEPEEEPVSVPIRIIESDKAAPTKHKPLKAKRVVRKSKPAKSVEGIKKASKKTKPRSKKKIAPVPPEATGFGFQKLDADNEES